MRKPFIILINVGYWIMYLLLLSLFLLIISAGANKAMVSKQEIIYAFVKTMSMITIIPGLISFYTFYHYIFNRFLTKKRMGAAILYGLITVLVAGFTGLVGLNFITQEPMFSHKLKEIIIMILFMSFLCLVHGVIALVIKGFISWYGDIKVKESLQQKNFETELALVKMQLNPHFLFNTINNIDVLIEKDAAKASTYLNKLSDIMRFMLYETKTEDIPLEKELTYISKYIELQKIRNSNTEFVELNINGNPASLRIAPMLFVPFIENAFKHAANKRKQQAIVIHIEIKRNDIHFFCKNNYAKNPLNRDEPGGLGNDLIAKRLQLLYSNNHELDISQTEEDYTVSLIIHTLS